MKFIKQLSLCALTFLGMLISAQSPDLEITSGSRAAGNGPVLDSGPFTFFQNTDNPTGTTYSAYNPPLTVTFTITNPQVTSGSGISTVTNSPVNFGYLGNGAVNAIIQRPSVAGAPADNNFTSSGATTTGTGIAAAGTYTVAQSNYAVSINQSVNYLTGQPTGGTYYQADLTMTFNRPVNNPILHFGGLGGVAGGGGFTGEYELKSSNTPVTLSLLSTATSLALVNGGNTITNNSSLINTAGPNSGSGSVLVTGTGITTITFKVYVRGNGNASTWGTSASADGYTLGISLLESDLAVTKTVNNSVAIPGSNVTFTITATNNGASHSTNTKVTDVLPSGYTFVSATPSTGSYNSSTGVWTIGTLNTGTSATMTIVATVKRTGNYDNSANISGDNSDPIISNNTATATVIPDSDGDGIADNVDLDDDNDGILDTVESNCTATTPLSLSGWKAKVYDAPNGIDGWTQISSSTTFPTASYSQIAFFDYNEYAGTSDAFDIRYNNELTPSNPDISNYIGAQIPWGTNEDFAIQFNKTINYLEAGTYQFDLEYGDDHVFLYKNGVKVSQQQNAYSGVPITNFGTVSVVAGDVISLLVVEENLFNTDLRVNATKTAGSCYLNDFDGDGIPNYLDLDSDNDGCVDAVEGGQNILPSQLVSAGGILSVGTGSTASNQNLCSGTTCVDANGVPTVVGATGQSIGDSQNATVNQCTDSDGDGIPDNIDVDDDNDGILDTVECNAPWMTWTVNDPTPGGSGTAGDAVITGSLNGMNVTVTNNSNLRDPSTQTAGNVFNTYPGTAGLNNNGANIVGKPVLNMANSAAGVTYTFTFASPTTSDMYLHFTGFDLSVNFSSNVTIQTLVNGTGIGTNIFTLINNPAFVNDGGLSALLPSGTTSFSFTYPVFGGDNYFVGISGPCVDTDNDGTPDYLDLDSDNDGCLDAIEGGASITTAQLVNSGGTVTVGTGSTASNQNLCAGTTCVSTSGTNIGLPQLTTPSDYSNTTGQTIGSSQDATISGCVCYNPPTDLASSVPVNHGITVLKRAGTHTGITTANDWPMVRNSAYTALESKTKGFVITRNANPETSIANPVVGMMVFDTDAPGVNGATGCLKIYTGSGAGEGWKCFNTQGCP